MWGSRKSRSATVVRQGIIYEMLADSAKIVGFTKHDPDVTIPDTVQDKPVTVVGKEALRGNTILTSIALPESVATIGAQAFAGCTSLEYAELPPDLEVLNAGAFEGCSKLRTVMLPYELRRIASRAFANCQSLLDTPHFVKTGISATMVVDRSLVEHSLPTALEYIGAQAFAGCTSLTKVVVPFLVSELNEAVFGGCSSLRTVWLHSNVTELKSGAFKGCVGLERVRLPSSIGSIGDEAIENGTTVVCSENSYAHRFARNQGLPIDTAELPAEPIVSALGSAEGLTLKRVLSTPELMQFIVDHYDVRPAMERRDRPVPPEGKVKAAPSRFQFDGLAYSSVEETGRDFTVNIAMVGDLMCRSRQQSTALQDGAYDFSANLAPIKHVIAQSDLAIGNMETMAAESFPYMHEMKYVDDRPHLNSPPEFLSAIRNAGFDVVMNAQNHMYDTGTRGVFETLDALNRAELIHGGMYADPREQRFLLFNVKGMKIAIVSYLDGARQKMKQANFTEEGISAFASHFDAEAIQRDVSAAKSAGAEFVLAYCHWGREYTDQITERQARFAQMVADAGADYIFGSHSHCPQPYTILASQDGRRVPVIYSGGNFLSDLGLKKPYTQDTFISSLTLTRNELGQVVVLGDGYVPCRIVEDNELAGFVRVVPTEELALEKFQYDPLRAEEDCRRLAMTLGVQYDALSASNFRTPPDARVPDDEDVISRFSLREPQLVEQFPRSESPVPSFVANEGIWRRSKETSQGEISLMCLGSATYDRTLERNADMGDSYQFRSSFKHVRAILQGADLVVGSLEAVVADKYPRMSDLPKSVDGKHYVKARSEYLEALAYAGVDCLALAHPYNLDAGVRGIVSTERAVLDHNMVPSGLGAVKEPVFDINGIKLAVLSYTLDSYRTRSLITGEGAKTLLNVFDVDRFTRTVKYLKSTGVEFILVYLNCRSASGKYRLAERLHSARDLSEAGADYVVCTTPSVLSRYERYMTRDGRSVPIASGMGTFAGGRVTESSRDSAALKLVLRKTPEGVVSVDDSYVPLNRMTYHRGAVSPTVPAMEPYADVEQEPKLAESAARTAARLGRELSIDRNRKVRIATHYVPQLTPMEISNILGEKFSGPARSALGEAANDKVTCIVARKGDLQPGCVAVLTRHPSHRKAVNEITISDAIAAGAVMAISAEPYEEIPGLIVENPWEAYSVVTGAIRDKYDPVTVAITGTAGKTTAKELMAESFNRHFNTLAIEGNYNTISTVGLVVQKLSSEIEAYLQEVHGGSQGTASAVSRIIKPDVCLITNIGDGHLEQMGTIENVIQGKMQLIDGLRDGGILVLNNDNEHLREQNPMVPTVRYSLEDSTCDYYARNIRDAGKAFEFEIVSPAGAHDVVLNSQGIHNVSNAVGIFAASHIAGVPPHKIVAGIAAYRPASNRQNIVEIGGYTLFVDAYNSNLLSVESALATLRELPIRESGRRIAVLGDMGEQGEKFAVNHDRVGSLVADGSIDLLISTGKGMRLAASAARSRGVRVMHFDDIDLLRSVVRDEIIPGDVILFKAAAAAGFDEKIVQPLFGRVV